MVPPNHLGSVKNGSPNLSIGNRENCHKQNRDGTGVSSHMFLMGSTK